jgi:hypothetical protein
MKQLRKNYFRLAKFYIADMSFSFSLYQIIGRGHWFPYSCAVSFLVAVLYCTGFEWPAELAS